MVTMPDCRIASALGGFCDDLRFGLSGARYRFERSLLGPLHRSMSK